MQQLNFQTPSSARERANSICRTSRVGNIALAIFSTIGCAAVSVHTRAVNGPLLTSQIPPRYLANGRPIQSVSGVLAAPYIRMSEQGD
jgi:hypothetical protein